VKMTLAGNAQVRIQLRRSTAAEWSAANPVLAAGEAGFELDTGRLKVGDGIRNWLNLPYSSGATPATSAPLDVGARSSGSSLAYARADHSHAFPSAVTFAQVTASKATVAGDLSVTGRLIGGSHTHSTSQITNWDSAFSLALGQYLVAGANVSLTQDASTGVITIASSGGTPAGTVTSVSGRTGDILLSTYDMEDWPETPPAAGQFLSYDGTDYLWANPFTDGGVNTVNDLSGNVLLQAGANVTVVPNPSTGAIVISATTSAGTGDVTSVNGLVGAIDIAAGSGLALMASGTTITLNASIGYDDLTGLPEAFPPDAHAHIASDITDLEEFVEDQVSFMLVAGTNVALTYDDNAGTLTIDAQGADAPSVVAGTAIAVDTTVPGEVEVSVDGTLDGGSYDGVAIAADPAYFSIQPENQLVTFGTAIFTARVENADSPSYQWQKAEAGTDTWLGLADVSPVSGATTNTLTISPVSDSDNGDRFRLQVTHSGGNVLVSNEAILSTVALIITDQPLSGEFEEAATIDVEPFLLAIADGGTSPYSYQWQKWNGSAWADVSGETFYYVDSISGLLGASESERVERWRVKITDDVGVSIVSDEARITIRAGAPSITLDPTSQTISSGAATFTCEYQGKGAVPSWERRYPSDDGFSAIGKAGTVTTPTPGTYRSTLSLSGLTGNDNGSEYRLRVANSAGDAVSAAATLGTSAPIISSQPQDATVVENNQAVFAVVASYGGGVIAYQWQEKTAGGSWANLSGATSATLTLPGVSVPLGRDGSEFRVLVTGGGVTTTSKPAMLTVISAPDAGDAVFTIDPASGTIEEGGGYALTAVSSWLETTSHYAAVRVQYDNGAVEYHSLSTGTSWNGTVTRLHPAAAHGQYNASLTLPRSAWVSIIASTSDPTVTTASGATTTLQPWALAKFDVRDCSATADPSRPRIGVIQHPVSQTLPAACQGSANLNVPDPPYSYVESQRARVTVAPRQAFIGPVPKTGFWNPPTERQFAGACDTTGMHIVACAKGATFGSYLYSSDGGKSWMTRNLPYGVKAQQVLHAFGKFYIFYGTFGYLQTHSALESDNNGLSFRPTGWNFVNPRNGLTASLAGNRLYVVATRAGNTINNLTPWYHDIYTKTSSGPWVLTTTIDAGRLRGVTNPQFPDDYYVSYAHNRWYFRNTWSTDGVTFTNINGPGATTYHPVTLADQTQNYVLASNGSFAPVDANLNGTPFFSPVTNGQPGGGPQAGDWLYFGSETPGSGASFFRKGTGNPGVNEKLLGHTTYWTGNQRGEWADIQIMSWYFGSGYGPNLDMTYYNVVSSPLVEGVIFTPDRIIHLFRYRYSTATGGGSRGGGSIPVPPN
jgi:hypothetical protein